MKQTRHELAPIWDPCACKARILDTDPLHQTQIKIFKCPISPIRAWMPQFPDLSQIPPPCYTPLCCLCRHTDLLFKATSFYEILFVVPFFYPGLVFHRYHHEGTPYSLRPLFKYLRDGRPLQVILSKISSPPPTSNTYHFLSSLNFFLLMITKYFI